MKGYSLGEVGMSVAEKSRSKARQGRAIRHRDDPVSLVADFMVSDGCEISESCLVCPLVICRHDKTLQAAIEETWKAGLMPEGIAKHYIGPLSRVPLGLRGEAVNAC